ncbi:hypothetical protein X735_04575 [Mesorhizobium sp. L2C085B000]|nr:hypothetical protein X767_19210 [Mesorhizobium sp. LSJC264A00]ESZ17610.1 hypothetical protein X735_04575 [Mesorhizobium sp. L2C085B000]ESZ35524.1 hypothetical protein X733_07230 [Mesorhizobium sp. L2C067A000]
MFQPGACFEQRRQHDVQLAHGDDQPVRRVAGSIGTGWLNGVREPLGGAKSAAETR